MNGFIALAESICKNDASLRYSYVTNVKNTTYLAFTLMNLQAAWQNVLETDRTKVVIDSMTPNGAALASSDNLQYQKDSNDKDTQCGQWNSIIQTDQTEIGSDTDDRKANFSLADGGAAALAEVNSYIIEIN